MVSSNGRLAAGPITRLLMHLDGKAGTGCNFAYARRGCRATAASHRGISDAGDGGVVLDSPHTGRDLVLGPNPKLLPCGMCCDRGHGGKENESGLHFARGFEWQIRVLQVMTPGGCQKERLSSRLPHSNEHSNSADIHAFKGFCVSNQSSPAWGERASRLGHSQSCRSEQTHRHEGVQFIRPIILD